MIRIRNQRGGFLLFEAMLAVVIFALAALALGKSMENLHRAERYRREDSLARRLLANRMTEILAGAVPLTDKSSEKFEKGPWAGMELQSTREPLELKNEKEQELFGLYTVTLVLKWKSREEVVSRDMSFIIYPRQR
jgi:type II secretory pathway component PulJ